MAQDQQVPRPADDLVDRVVDGRWAVKSRLSPAGGTGGNFSTSYLATDQEGNEVFVKALDFSSALASDDPTTSLQRLTEAYNFERDLLRDCGERKLRRIVQILDDGIIRDFSVPVPYLVFEHADRGDVRSVLSTMDELDVAFAFRSLHNTAVGLRQLHSIGVAHQDVKPSNVVVFEEAGSKITDLGRSSTKERAAQHDTYVVAGDPTYCPPEQMYGYASPNWDRRRTATDLYQLGSMVLFMFTSISMTQALLAKLDLVHHPYVWTGDADAVLPYLLAAFDEVLHEAHPCFPPAVADDLVNAVRYLCHPDLSQRGHPSDKPGRGSNYNLERFISLFDRLAYRAEHRLLAFAS